MAATRRNGFRTGINILTTIGHHEEDLPHTLSGDYTPMTCFRDNCLEIFAERCGTVHTRESLARAFVTGSTAEQPDTPLAAAAIDQAHDDSRSWLSDPRSKLVRRLGELGR